MIDIKLVFAINYHESSIQYKVSSIKNPESSNQYQVSRVINNK